MTTPEPRGKHSEQLNLVSKRGKTLRFNTLCNGDGSPLPGEISIEIEYANQSMNAALSAEETRKLSGWLPASPPLSDDERNELEELRKRRDYLKARGLTVGMAKDAGRDAYLTYVIEPGSVFDDGELIAENAKLQSELAQARAEVAEAKRDAAAVRELMNVYNLGGWTDAVAPMKRAEAAEAERDKALAALKAYHDEWMSQKEPDMLCLHSCHAENLAIAALAPQAEKPQ